MTSPHGKIAHAAIRLIGASIGGTKLLALYIFGATLSTAEMLISIACNNYVRDISDLKKNVFKQIDAATKEKMAKATEAANRATRTKRSKAIVQAEALAEAKIKLAEAKEIEAKANLIDAETEKVQADAKKSKADAEAILKDADSRSIEAQAKLIEVLAKLRNEGGDLYINKNEMQEIIDRGLPRLTSGDK